MALRCTCASASRALFLVPDQRAGLLDRNKERPGSVRLILGLPPPPLACAQINSRGRLDAPAAAGPDGWSWVPRRTSVRVQEG